MATKSLPALIKQADRQLGLFDRPAPPPPPPVVPPRAALRAFMAEKPAPKAPKTPKTPLAKKGEPFQIPRGSVLLTLRRAGGKKSEWQQFYFNVRGHQDYHQRRSWRGGPVPYVGDLYYPNATPLEIERVIPLLLTHGFRVVKGPSWD